MWIRLIVALSILPGLVYCQDQTDHTIIFKFWNDGYDLAQVEMDVREEFPEIGELSFKQIFPPLSKDIIANSKKVVDKYQFHLIYELQLESISKKVKVLNFLKEITYLKYAQPRYLPKYTATYNDSLFYRNISHLKKIGLPDAWQMNQGDTSVIIGITDSGTDTDHPDLLANFAYNLNDPINGKDDDGDGYTDNFLGWDLAENDNNVQAFNQFHGVHMNGIVGAEVDNEIGMAGIAYKCRILPIKIADDTTDELIAAYEGIKYAADAGCNVINCSWGSYFVENFEQDIIDYVLNETEAIIVASAGNDNKEDILYPAAFEGVVAVANVDTNDIKSFDSNFHSLVDLTAPGVYYTSTWNDGLYQSLSGTSVSTAVVSGGLGLLLSKFPTYSRKEIIELLKNSATNIDYRNIDHKDKLGDGRLQLQYALNEQVLPDVKIGEVNIYPNPVPVSGNRRVVVQWIADQGLDYAIRVFNTNGVVQYHKEVTVKQLDEVQLFLDTSSWSKGLYFIEFTGSGRSRLQKIVVL